MPTTPPFTGLGLTSAGLINANPGALNFGDPAFAGPLPATSAPASKPYGVLYNVSSWAATSDFAMNGATASIVSNQIQLSGGNGTANNSIDRLPYTCLPRWKMTARIQTGTTINSTSFGVGIGVRSYNSYGYYDAIGRVDLSSNGTAGNVLFGQTNYTGTYADQATGATSLTWSAGDYIVLTVTRDEDLFTVEVYNDTAHSAVASVQYRASMAYNATSNTYILPNTGRFAVFAFGGTQNLNSLKIESQTLAKADIAIVGDSKSVGYFAGSYAAGYARRIASAFSVANLSGGSDRTQDVLLRMPEIIALAPRTVLLNVGRNDIGNGIASTVYLANYANIVSQLTAAGISVVHLLPFYELVATQTPLTNYITSTWATTYIDPALSTWSGTAANILAPDNVHLNSFANERIARAVLSYFGVGDKVYPLTNWQARREVLAQTVSLPTGTPTVIDCSLIGPFTFTLGANTTFSFANFADGQDVKVVVINPAAYTVTWPAESSTFKWSGLTAPTQTASKTDLYFFRSIGGIIYASATQNF